MHQPKILLVEDNLLLRWWALSSLDYEGFIVKAPESVEEAFRLSMVYPFDVLITDLRLPNGHNGFEVLEGVRKFRPKVLAVLISAEADGDLAARARSAGFDFVIEKPFPPAELVSTVLTLTAKQPAAEALA
jgi:two-component system cell cycle response regulator CtrA